MGTLKKAVAGALLLTFGASVASGIAGHLEKQEKFSFYDTTPETASEVISDHRLSNYEEFNYAHIAISGDKQTVVRVPADKAEVFGKFELQDKHGETYEAGRQQMYFDGTDEGLREANESVAQAKAKFERAQEMDGKRYVNIITR